VQNSISWSSSQAVNLGCVLPWLILGSSLLLYMAPAWGNSARPVPPEVQSAPIALPHFSPNPANSNPATIVLTSDPYSKSLSQEERATFNPAPLLPQWKKGLGDEGSLDNMPAAKDLTTPSFALADAAIDLELSPEVVKGSPVLQRWLEGVPNVLSDIANTPGFRTRVRLSYDRFPSTNQAAGWNVGIEDIFVGRTGLTVSGDYQTAFDSTVQRDAWGAELRYYLRPLGSYVNLAPVVGYRRLSTSLYSTEGVNLGLRLLLVPSRGGGADIALTQTWVAPGTDREVGLTTLAAGYALTYNLRLFTEIQQQNARQRQDSRLGLGLEWML